jgi:ubiquinone/menaquinone biosynthesis C-methylase UbiE
VTTETQHVHDFDPFAKELAYIRVNEKLIERVVARLKGMQNVNLLDLGAATGLMTMLAFERAKAAGLTLVPTLLDIDAAALQQAKFEITPNFAHYVHATADVIPLAEQKFDAVIFANSVHMLDEGAKEKAIAESYRVLKPGGLLAINSTFYDGAYPEESKPFYSRWIRRSIAEINRRLPQRNKGEKVAAMEWLLADGYVNLLTGAGFKVVERRERRVKLSQASVRAISTYKEFAKGALHATDEDAAEASMALQESVKQAFNDLNMKFLPRNWLELIANKA